MEERKAGIREKGGSNRAGDEDQCEERRGQGNPRRDAVAATRSRRRRRRDGPSAETRTPRQAPRNQRVDPQRRQPCRPQNPRNAPTSKLGQTVDPTPSRHPFSRARESQRRGESATGGEQRRTRKSAARANRRETIPLAGEGRVPQSATAQTASRKSSREREHADATSRSRAIEQRIHSTLDRSKPEERDTSQRKGIGPNVNSRRRQSQSVHPKSSESRPIASDGTSSPLQIRQQTRKPGRPEEVLAERPPT